MTSSTIVMYNGTMKQGQPQLLTTNIDKNSKHKLNYVNNTTFKLK